MCIFKINNKNLRNYSKLKSPIYKSTTVSPIYDPSVGEVPVREETCPEPSAS